MSGLLAGTDPGIALDINIVDSCEEGNIQYSFPDSILTQDDGCSGVQCSEPISISGAQTVIGTAITVTDAEGDCKATCVIETMAQFEQRRLEWVEAKETE